MLSTQFSLPVIETSSVGRIAYSRMKRCHEGVVQAVYNKVINVLFDGELVSLVSEEVGRGPLNITLKLPPGLSGLSALGVNVGDKVRIHGSILGLGESTISVESASIYSSKQKRTRSILPKSEIESNLAAMRKTAVLHGKMGGLGELLSEIAPEKAGEKAKALNIFSSFALPRVFRLEQALRAEDGSALRNAVHELIGLGPGLTPSSDDMLAGLVLLSGLFAKNCEGVERVSKLLAQTIMKEVHGRTTLVSEELLKQASCGRGNEPVMKLCTALLTEGPRSVELETRRVLEIGETSGTDIVLGIILGAMLCLCKQPFLAKRNFDEH